jgi:hypothetical protein
MSVTQEVTKQFWPRGWRPNIWAVFDAARDPRIYGRIVYSGLLRECLFAGELPPAVQHTAPYLVQLEHNDRKTLELIEGGWDNSWGVFLQADVGIKTLSKHLRTLLRVQGPTGKFMLFRYYDPRVLRAYLPTCLPEELTRFYGPIERAWVEEGSGSERMLQFEVKENRLVTTSFEAFAGLE